MHTDPGEALADAVEAVARMLPAQVPEGGEYRVARAVVGIVVPHLLEHLRPVADEDLLTKLLCLHVPGVPDADGLRVCREDLHAWPCSTARLCAARAESVAPAADGPGAGPPAGRINVEPS